MRRTKPRRRTPRSLPDHIRPGARVLFIGINPGLRSAEVGHHFAGHSNRFWRLMHESRLLPEHVTCEDDARLPEFGFGITNLIRRATAGIDSLRAEEYARGRRALLARIKSCRPEVVALVGVTVYRALFATSSSRGTRQTAPHTRTSHPFRLGMQRETLAGTRIFVLPNPSGRNATVSYDAMLAAFRRLKRHLDGRGRG